MKVLLNRVLNNDLCSGCGMCSSVADDDAIKIRLTGDGYHRPVLNAQYQNKPVANEQTSAAFAKSCPALNLTFDRTSRPTTTPSGARSSIRSRAMPPITRSAVPAPPAV